MLNLPVYVSNILPNVVYVSLMSHNNNNNNNNNALFKTIKYI